MSPPFFRYGDFSGDQRGKEGDEGRGTGFVYGGEGVARRDETERGRSLDRCAFACRSPCMRVNRLLGCGVGNSSVADVRSSRTGTFFFTTWRHPSNSTDVRACVCVRVRRSRVPPLPEQFRPHYDAVRLQDGSRLTALLHSSLSMSGLEGGGVRRGGGGGDGGANSVGTVAPGGAEMGREVGELLRSAVVGGDGLLLEHILVTCHPERVKEWRNGDQVGENPGGGGGGREGGVKGLDHLPPPLL